jgi:hypothetical protein
MPQSFDQARQAAGIQPKPYQPLSVRENSGNTGLLTKLPGSYASEIAKTQGPPKASAAPVAGTQNVFIGLSAALNDYQQQLVKQGKRSIADQYIIEFAPPGLGSSTVKRPGPQDSTTAPMQNPDSAEKLNPARDSVNRSGRTWPIKGGTQIIKVIDDVMRNSSYITDQQNVEINTAVDPKTGIQTQTINAKAGTGNFQWYKISVATRDLGYDPVIRDHAYRMTFIITPYAVAQMTSQYFPDSRYRGVHKAYQYWFTGANTQVISYEQSYNNAYRLFLSGIGADAQKQVTTDFRDQNRYVYMATSPNQAVGAKNYANEPGNNAASFLYDPTSLAQVKMRIVGDPAWLQQGEVGLGVNAKTFDFSPFNADGSINYDSQAVMFSMAFNTPADYDFNTGLVNVNANNRNGQPQEYYTYQAVRVKSYFSKGRFEQELEGKLLIEKRFDPNAQNRPTTGNAPATDTRVNKTSKAQSERSTSVERITSVQEIQYDQMGNPISSIDTSGSLPSPQPAPPPRAPTSSGPLLDLTTLPTGLGGANLQTTPTLNTNATGQSLVPQPTTPQKMNREF